MALRSALFEDAAESFAGDAPPGDTAAAVAAAFTLATLAFVGVLGGVLAREACPAVDGEGVALGKTPCPTARLFTPSGEP